jgi:hypothetical protein
MPETIRRLKKDVADKGIMFFNEIDLARQASPPRQHIRLLFCGA